MKASNPNTPNAIAIISIFLPFLDYSTVTLRLSKGMLAFLYSH